MATANKSFCFVLPVWNEFYVKLFLDYALPSQLAPGNLDATIDMQTMYVIYTFAKDLPLFKNNQLMQQLEGMLDVRYAIITSNFSDHRIRAGECYQDGIALAQELGANVFLLLPDVVYSSGSFQYVKTQFANGYKALLAPCHSVTLASTQPELTEFFSTTGSLDLSGRNCIDILLRNMHQNTRNKFYDMYAGNLMPGSLCWQIGNQGIISHSLHLPPIAVDVGTTSCKFADAIDRDFLLRLNLEPDTICLVTDSDDFAMFELIANDHVVDATYRKHNPDDVVDWAIVHANQQHRATFATVLRQKSSAFQGLDHDWQLVEARAQQLTDQVANELQSESLAFIFKHRYAFIRRFMMELHFANRLGYPKSLYILSKVFLQPHQAYLFVAVKFIALQNKVKQSLFKSNPSHKVSIFNINYILLQHCKQQGIDLSQQRLKIAVASNPQIAALVTTCFDKEIFELATATSPAALSLPTPLINHLHNHATKLVQFKIDSSSPTLLQIIKFPYSYTTTLLRILRMNIVFYFSSRNSASNSAL